MALFSWIFVSAVNTGNITLPFGLGYLTPELKYGDLMTFGSVIISLIALYAAWSKDREMRSLEYSDKIKNAIGVILAKLERRQKIYLNIFHKVQPLIVDAELYLKNSNNLDETRNLLWKNITNMKENVNQSILNEQIEVASKDIYGYSPDLENLLHEVLKELGDIEQIFDMVIWRMIQYELKFIKIQDYSDFGTRLQMTFNMNAYEYDQLTKELLNSLREELRKIIESKKPNEIVNREIKIKSSVTDITTDAYKMTLKGLRLSNNENYPSALDHYTDAIENNGSRIGNLAGKWLVYKMLSNESDAKSTYEELKNLVLKINE